MLDVSELVVVNDAGCKPPSVLDAEDADVVEEASLMVLSDVVDAVVVVDAEVEAVEVEANEVDSVALLVEEPLSSESVL